ncbi:MAG TPA: carboxymuconolactone decarboxylase family protein, partial [Planctomycetaceae bacterium]|nr:carboxymuconolactone decarboxylase family protein [Planctomycetaceae bacterium]
PLDSRAEVEQALGERADDYEAVLRHSYTPWSGSRRGPRGPRDAAARQREQDPAMTLSYAFKTKLFWIVSRVNNCQYCIGHQESKLLGAGLSEDEIAALDGDWRAHTPAERAAFAFARKLSHEPHELTDADIDGLREHYTDLQILEMAMSVARNNVSNRWKEGIGVPQRADEGGYSRVDEDPELPRGTYLTPTSERFQDAISKVAPVVLDGEGEYTRLAVCRRPPLDSRAEVEQALAAARTRQPRLPLVDEREARSLLAERAPQGPLPQWVRLLANFPEDGVGHVASIVTADEQGDLSPLLKAQLSWIIARRDRAWYALGQARHRLRELGQSDEQIFALDGDCREFSPREQALFTVAKKLAASPVVLTDAEVARAVEAAGPRDVVQTIHYTTIRAFFDRVTEAAGLRLEQ